MNDAPHHHQWFDRALEMYQAGHEDNSIDLLTRLLGEDPDHADAHALLALCLVQRQRIHAARTEAGIALASAPESAFAHLAMASALMALRRYTLAGDHIETALSLEPENASALRISARLDLLRERLRAAQEKAERACALDPTEADNWALRAAISRAGGDRMLARAHAMHALELDPEHVHALVALGFCDLHDGRREEARAHALWALQLAPGDEDVHTLLAAVKASESLLLGLWWRFQSFVAGGSTRRTLLLLVGLYLAYRALDITLRTQGLQAWSPVLTGAWFAFCAYTWFAPVLFQRNLRRELESVRLRPDY